MDFKFVKDQKVIMFVLLGLIFLGLGFFIYRTGGFTSKNKVEIIDKNTPEPQQVLIVEVSGAVEKPGVYKLSSGSRIEDLLIFAGGLSAGADREWFEKNINRASKIYDGQKLYIYHSGEVTASYNDGIKVDQSVLGAAYEGRVNINTSSLSELDKLPGIGPVFGQRIIEGRSYSTTYDLVKKGVLKESTYQKIKDLITI